MNYGNKDHIQRRGYIKFFVAYRQEVSEEAVWTKVAKNDLVLPTNEARSNRYRYQLNFKIPLAISVRNHISKVLCDVWHSAEQHSAD